MKKLILIISGIVLALVVFFGITHHAKKTSSKNSVSDQSLTVQTAPREVDEALMTGRIDATDDMIRNGRLGEARIVLQEIASEYADTQFGKIAQEKLDQTGLEAYFKSLNDTNSRVYEVKPGDNLARIAKQFGVTVGTIRMANGIKGDRIWPYQKLKIMQDVWSVVVDKSTNILMLKAGERMVRTYSVATGSDKSTPVGKFKIVNRLIDPTWYYEGKVIPPGTDENPLGTRWLGFDLDGYGLHGTTDPDKIGEYVTLGCVRMRNEDVEEIFELLPVGTEVSILE